MSEYWDACFETDDYMYGLEPNRFLKAQDRLFKPGRSALAVADGEGRNGVWLAEQGLDVVSLDVSRAGLAKARALAEKRGVRLRTVHADLLTWSWPVGAFDHLVVIFIHFEPSARASIHAAFQRALRPGGHLIYVAFAPGQLENLSGGPERGELLLTSAELRKDFAEMTVLQLEEGDEYLNEGPLHQGLARTVRMVAKKPT
jgi:SAM-dependent methyltransferase